MKVSSRWPPRSAQDKFNIDKDILKLRQNIEDIHPNKFNVESNLKILSEDLYLKLLQMLKISSLDKFKVESNLKLLSENLFLKLRQMLKISSSDKFKVGVFLSHASIERPMIVPRLQGYKLKTTRPERNRRTQRRFGKCMQK